MPNSAALLPVIVIVENMDQSANNKRIAKNTLLLYCRTLLLMIISLYTSRVVLSTLGVDVYGVYNVVGGFVAMFAVISGALSSAISRFLTFELGKGDKYKLNRIFSTSVNIQILIGLIIFVLGETVGLWFLNTQLNIPQERMFASNWVLQCSLFSFIINLISVPYNAAIIAHERMKAFAYVSILEAVLKLLIVYILFICDLDKLILYAILNVVVALIIRLVYGFFCASNFTECKYRFVYDKSSLTEMAGFAGWNCLTNGAYILNMQGVNLLVNVFFGVTANAARGLATQVDAAIMQFVNNFTTAINPQIIKSYASGDKEAMFKLICRGAKFSYFMLLFFAIPFICEADTILTLWLGEVPEHTATFLRLTVLASMANILGNAQYTACQATGNIRSYTIIITTVGCLVFPITWLLYKSGFSVECTYVVFIVIYLILDVIRLFLMRSLLQFPIRMFVRDVFITVFAVSIVAVILPFLVVSVVPPIWWRLFITLSVSVFSVGVSIYVLGLQTSEKHLIIDSIKAKIKRK